MTERERFEADVRKAFKRLVPTFNEPAPDTIHATLPVGDGLFIDVWRLPNGEHRVDRCKGSSVADARDKAVESYRVSRLRLRRLTEAMTP